MKKRSVTIAGHQTSITLEEEFWKELQRLAKKHNLSVNKLTERIDKNRAPDTNLSSALRLFILRALQEDR